MLSLDLLSCLELAVKSLGSKLPYIAAVLLSTIRAAALPKTGHILNKLRKKKLEIHWKGMETIEMSILKQKPADVKLWI